MKLTRFSVLTSLLAASVGVLLAGQLSCSVIVNQFEQQCTTTQDCIDLASRQGLGDDGKPRVTGLVCSDKHVCEPEKGCHSNLECQTAHNGEPYICRASDRTCQSLILASDEPDAENICKVLADPADYKNENTIWLGAVVIAPPYSYQGLEMVRQDFNKLANGLPPATAGGARRPLGFVYCDAEKLEAGAAHLVNDLQLPAIITSLDTSSEISLLTKYSTANGNQVFQLSTSAGGPLLKTIDNQGLLLDLVLINENYDTETLELVKNYYVPQLRKSGGPLTATALPRVAVVHSSTATYSNTAVKIVGALQAGKTTSKVQDFGYGDSDNPEGTPAQYASVVAKVLAFKPHVIVVLGDEELGPDNMNVSAGIDVPIEKGWASAADGQPPPQWLGILGSVGQLPKDMLTLDSDAQLDWGSRSLFIQQHYDFKGTLFRNYIGQLKQIVGEDPDGIIDSEGTSPYNEFLREGAYLTSYSIALLAAQGKPVTGPNLAAAARSFGTANSGAFTVGPDEIFPALQSIARTSKPFDLQNFQGWTGFDDKGFATYTFADDVACLTPAVDDTTEANIVGSLQPTGGLFEVNGALTGDVKLSGCVGH